MYCIWPCWFLKSHRPFDARPRCLRPLWARTSLLGLFCSVPFQRRSLLIEFLVSLVGLQGLVVFLDDGSADTRNTPSSALRRLPSLRIHHGTSSRSDISLTRILSSAPALQRRDRIACRKVILEWSEHSPNRII